MPLSQKTYTVILSHEIFPWDNARNTGRIMLVKLQQFSVIYLHFKLNKSIHSGW